MSEQGERWVDDARLFACEILRKQSKQCLPRYKGRIVQDRLATAQASLKFPLGKR